MGEDFNGDYKPGRSLVSSHTGSQDPGIPVSHTGSQDPGISVSHTGSQDPGISVSHTGSQDPGISVSHTGSQTSSDAQDLNNSINSTHLNLASSCAIQLCSLREGGLISRPAELGVWLIRSRPWPLIAVADVDQGSAL